MIGVYSLIFTVVIIFIVLYPVGGLFQLMFGEFGTELAMFATIIFTIIFCTQIIIEKIDDRNKNAKNS